MSFVEQGEVIHISCGEPFKADTHGLTLQAPIVSRLRRKQKIHDFQKKRKHVFPGKSRFSKEITIIPTNHDIPKQRTKTIFHTNYGFPEKRFSETKHKNTFFLEKCTFCTKTAIF